MRNIINKFIVWYLRKNKCVQLTDENAIVLLSRSEYWAMELLNWYRPINCRCEIYSYTMLENNDEREAGIYVYKQQSKGRTI